MKSTIAAMAVALAFLANKAAAVPIYGPPLLAPAEPGLHPHGHPTHADLTAHAGADPASTHPPTPPTIAKRSSKKRSSKTCLHGSPLPTPTAAAAPAPPRRHSSRPFPGWPNRPEKRAFLKGLYKGPHYHWTEIVAHWFTGQPLPKKPAKGGEEDGAAARKDDPKADPNADPNKDDDDNEKGRTTVLKAGGPARTFENKELEDAWAGKGEYRFSYGKKLGFSNQCVQGACGGVVGAGAGAGVESGGDAKFELGVNGEN